MNDAERKLQGFSNSLRKKGLRVYGLLGNFSNAVEVSGKSCWYYVRIQQAGSNRYSLGEFQGNVRPLYNLPVVIEQDPITGEQYIVGTDQTLLQYGIDGGNEEPAPSELPLHANYHGWGGDDQLDWIHTSQIFPLRVQPSITAKHVIVQGGLAPLDGGWVAVSASIDVDLTSYWPVTGTSYVLLYLSTATTVTVSVCGTNLASVGNPPPGKCALAAVRLSAVLTAVSWTDIVDMRFLDNLAFVEELGTEELDTNTVLQPDGAGAIAWTDKMELGAADLATDFPRAQTVIAQADSGHTYDQNIGIVGEAAADATYNAVGIGGVARVVGAKQARGVVGRGVVDASADTGECIGIQGLCNPTHAGGANIGVLGTAANGATNFSFYGQSGKMYSADDIQLAAGKTVDGVDVSAHAADASAHHARYTDAEALAAVPDATTTIKGKVELATAAEAQAGTSSILAVTPAGIGAKATSNPINHDRYTDAEALAAVPAASVTVQGKVELATDAETQTGTDTARAITPANLAAASTSAATANRIAKRDEYGYCKFQKVYLETLDAYTTPADVEYIHTKQDGATNIRQVTPAVLDAALVAATYKNAGARVYRSSTQSISSGSETAVSWTSESYDDDSNWTSGSATRLTVKHAGVYIVTACIQWQANTSGIRSVVLRLNGSTAISGATVAPAPGSGYATLPIVGVYKCAVNDYLEVVVYQDSGSSLTVGITYSFFAISRVA